MIDFKQVTKWWWGWNPETIEDWLENMEAQGWNLKHVGINAIRFLFTKGDRRRVRYCTDYQNKVKPDYMSIFLDAGWELVYQGSTGWYIWRMPYEDRRPEIFSDVESHIERNQRLTRFLTAITLLEIMLLVMEVVLNASRGFSVVLPIALIFAIFLGILAYFTLKLKASTKKLRARKI